MIEDCGFPSLSLTVTADLVADYGRANGDRNMLHYDQGAAQSAGFPAPLVHGALSAAVLMRACRDYFGPGWLSGGRISLRFVRPLFVGDTVTTGGRRIRTSQLDGAVRETLEVWCVDGSGEHIITGEATGEHNLTPS